MDERIELLDTSEQTQLYNKYYGQCNPQDVYLEINSDYARFRSNAEIGNAVTMDVWNGETVRIACPCFTASVANYWLENLEKEIITVMDGIEVEWDGNNHVGHLTEEAEGAVQEIDECLNNNIQEGECVEDWDASDWFAPCKNGLGVRHDSTDAELDALAEKYEAELEPHQVVSGISEYLYDLRRELQDKEDEED